MNGKAIITVNSTACLGLFLIVTLFAPHVYRLFPIGHYLTFHTLVELFGVIISLGIFATSWHTYPQSRDARGLFLGSSLLAVGLLGLFHTLSYPGMPNFLTPSSTSKAISFWIIMRMIFALAFFLSAFIKPHAESRWYRAPILLISASLVAFISLIVVAYFPQYLPTFYVEGKGLTATKVYLEYVITLVFLVAAFSHWRIYRNSKDRDLPFLIAAMIISAFSELSFTLYFSAYDIFNALGHVYELWAFLLIYRSVFLSTVRFPYERIEQLVADRTHELAKKSEQLMLATKHKSEFLANMSHELRTPLNSVIGFSEVLEDETFGPLNEKQRQYVQNILGSGKHLLSLINDVLDLSKVEAGQMEMRLEEISIREVLADIQSVMVPLAVKKGIKLAIEVDDSLSTLYVDPGKFKQIMHNLLSNAIKFTPDKGNVMVRGMSAGGVARFLISDTGPGIRKEDQDRIFEEFQQVDMGFAKKYEGTGLGLSITRHLIEMFGGRIWVESEYGKGSTFIFTIPLTCEAALKPTLAEK